MKYLLLSLLVFTSFNLTQCKSQNQKVDLKFECLSSTESEYMQKLYSTFENKLIGRYGKLKMSELTYNYVNDFLSNKIDVQFFKSFRIDNTDSEFYRLFIKESQLPMEEEKLDDNIIEELVIETGENTSQMRTDDYCVINPNSTYVSCILQQKSKNYTVNNLLQFFSVDVSTRAIVPTLILEFKQDDYEDKLLQTYVMFHLFLLPNLQL